jgi:hypothetical protein
MQPEDVMKNLGRRSWAHLYVVVALLWTLAGAAAQAPNPVPSVTAPLAPASVRPRSEKFKLTINGSGFVSGATVYWNQLPLRTTFVSATQVTAQVGAGYIARKGTVSVTVVNPAPGGGASNVAFFQIAQPSSAAAFSGSTAPTGSSPLAVISAELNGDRQQDLAVANQQDSTVSILLGNGDGTFQAQVTYATGQGPDDVLVGDFNGDGKLDLAVANNAADTISILLGNGDGTFQTHVDYATGLAPVRVVTGDFNGDGVLDLAVSNEQANTVSVLLGNGDGTFQTHVDYGVGEQPTGLAIADFNGDDVLDLAVANFTSNTVSLLAGNGDGTFQSPVDFATATGPVSLVAADFNGDGLPDLVVAELIASQVSFLPGKGNNTFGARVDYNTGLYPESVVAGVFNNEGVLDLALPTDDALGSVSVLLGEGNGAFQKSTDSPAGLLPVSITTGDFNNDGRLDVATADENSNSASALLETTALLSPTNLVFTSQTLGTTSTAQSLTLTNVSYQTLSISSISTAAPFAETDDCGDSLAGLASCTMSVTFRPTVPGTSNGTVSVSDGAVGSPQVASLTGTGTGPVASFNPSSVNFGNVNVGSQSSPETVTLSNTGNATLNIASVTVSGDFMVLNLCQSTLAAGKSCSIDLFFKPATGGTLTGTLTVTDNALGSPQTVGLTGVGLTPQVSLSPTSLNFGDQLINTVSAPQPVTLLNTGTAPLNISRIVASGSFGETNNCGSVVNSGASCTINVTFAPAGQGTRNGTVNVYDNATGSPQSVACTGSGTIVQLLPSSLNFGTVNIGTTSAPQVVTLKNFGSGSLSITSVNITGSNSGDFSQTNNCGKRVAAGATCTFSVTFTPQATGSLTASLSVSDSGGGSPQTVALSGTGN